MIPKNWADTFCNPLSIATAWLMGKNFVISLIFPVIVSKDWIFGRKKENADISNVQLEASQKVIDMITAMNDRLEAKVNDLSKKVDELTEEVIHLRTENSKLKSGKQPK
jgi:peptidoglycan hydrolase CwlO-like protein